MEKLRRDLAAVKISQVASAVSVAAVSDKTDQIAAVSGQIKIVSDGHLSAARQEVSDLRGQLAALQARADGLDKVVLGLQTISRPESTP
jgi:hypothetical protein